MQLVIKGRKIRQEDFTRIGMAGDCGAERIEFRLPRQYGETDLFSCAFYLRRRAPSGREGLELLKSSLCADGESILLQWEIGRDATAEAGILQIQLLALGSEELLWQSETAGFTVEAGLEGDAPLPVGEDAGNSVVLLSGRRLLIPDSLRCIGVQADENCHPVVFCLPRWYGGRDLSECSFRLKVVSSGGRSDVFFPTVTVEETRLLLRWLPAPPQTSCAGRLLVQLCAAAEGFAWQSEPGEFTVLTSLDAPPLIPPVESGLERLAAAVAADAAAVRTISAELGETARLQAEYARLQGDYAKAAAAGLIADRSGIFPELTALVMAVSAAGMFSPPEAGQIRVIPLSDADAVILTSGCRDAEGLFI